MELYQLRYFQAVCKELNFTRAATCCSVTQPTLTRGIKKLEQELGGPLFRRERNLTHLTDLGRLMRPHLERSLAESEAAKEKARGFLDLEDAPLNLGIMCTIGPARMIGLIEALSRAAPGIDLSIHETTANELIERLWEGNIDVALLAQPEGLRERFEAVTLYSERFVVAFPPGHRFEKFNTVSLTDLNGETYLERTKCEYADHIDGMLETQGVKLQLGYRSEREEWVQAMVLAGLGITLLPEHLPLFPELPTRVVSDPPVSRAIQLVTVAGRYFSPAVRQFVGLARAYSWSEPP